MIGNPVHIQGLKRLAGRAAILAACHVVGPASKAVAEQTPSTIPPDYNALINEPMPCHLSITAGEIGEPAGADIRIPIGSKPFVGQQIAGALSRIRALELGWYDGQDGLVPSKEGLDWLCESWGKHIPESGEMPPFFPCQDGGVLAEWRRGKLDISLELDLVSRSALLFIYDSGTRESEEVSLNLAVTADWQVLSKIISES